MSSGTQVEPNAAAKVVAAVSPRVMDRIANLGLSPRQQMLNRLYAYYRCAQHSSCKVDWNGDENVGMLDHEAIATAGFIPSGFYDAGATFPLKFRKPVAPHNLAKAVVDRFTGLLFSERRHPAFRVAGSPDTEDYAAAIAQASRLWAQMIQARAYGGSMGSVAVGFQFIEGRPTIEVHDPRWITPTFADRTTGKLLSLEKRYIFPKEERDRYTGRWETKWYWYRRVIDAQTDVLYREVEVEQGDEPDWQVAQEVKHGVEGCPVVWTQNLPVQDDVDGDPDCHGAYDAMDALDQLHAQAITGTVKNIDPTRIVITDAQLGALRKGSDNAVKLPVGGDVKFLELQGTSVDTAIKLRDVLRSQILEISACVLEHPDANNRTATEVQRLYEMMHDKADVLREQYGQRCVVPLMEMMVRTARNGARARSVNGAIVSAKVVLPPKLDENKKLVERVPPQAGPLESPLELNWPPHAATTAQDALVATQAAAAAKTAGLIDKEHAAKFVAPHFDVEDVSSMLETVEAEQAAGREQLEDSMMGRMQQAGIDGADEDTDDSDSGKDDDDADEK